MREVEDSPNRCPVCQRVQQSAQLCSECLLKALRLLRDEIVATEEHGEGAAEDGCPICQAIEQADTALSGEKNGEG